LTSRSAATAILAATSAILISLVFLIKDMDSPFEVGQNTYADVDLSMLFNLEVYMKDMLTMDEQRPRRLQSRASQNRT